jgi:hypothetical protein
MNILTVLFMLTIFVAIAGAAIYWWSECQYARNQLDQIIYAETATKPTHEEIMSVNLKKMYKELTDFEGGKIGLPQPQVADLVAAMGERWRTLPPQQAFAEFLAIWERAGIKSSK